MSEIPYTDTTKQYRLPHAEIPGCALVQDLIPLYLDGEVTPESHALMADHLQHCQRCSGYLAGARTVRAQILNEQQTIRAAQAKQPSVAQVREPVADSLGVALWQSLMALLYAAGLFAGLLGAAGASGRFPPLMFGALLVLSGLAGLLVVGSARMLSWLVLMVLTGASGVLLTLVTVLWGVRAEPLMILYGLGVVGLGAWGVWLHYMLQSGSTVQSVLHTVRFGARQAIFTAALSVIGILVCGFIALVSVFGLVSAYEPRQGMIAMLLLTLSGCGIVVLARRLGWLT
ncbi:MAG TPA: zf-HC2 domain-containing protein [Herpetosiphonaceae bacterium]